MPQYRKGSAYDPESQAFLDRFRLKNLWPSTGAVTQETQPLTPINLDPEPFHIETDVPDVQKPPTLDRKARDILAETLMNAPRREDYAPSKTRRIISGIAGGMQGAAYGAEKGAKLSTDIMESPYRRAAQDFESNVSPLMKLEELERAGAKVDLDQFKSYLDWLDTLTKTQQASPHYKANVAGMEAGARLRVEEPFKIDADTRRSAEAKLSDLRKAEADRENDARVLSGQKEIKKMEQAFEDSYRKADRALKKSMQERDREIRLELEKEKAGRTKYSRISANQQVTARQEAENRVLSGLSGESGGPSDEELAGIAVGVCPLQAVVNHAIMNTTPNAGS